MTVACRPRSDESLRQPLPRPDASEVHVWSSPPTGADGPADALALLDDSERARAERFRMKRDRARFISHHAFTRRVLARYLGVVPADIDMRVAAHGKPEIDPGYGVMFNTSRSGGLSLVAVAGRHVGVDVERVRTLDDVLRLADGLFSDQERQFLRTVPGVFRNKAFLALWTRKESVVKTFGMGLSVPLDSFEVGDLAVGPRGPWRGQLGRAPFVVEQLDAPSGWVAAVSVAGTRLSIRQMDPATLAS
jgi:4'-phosphopantetheinyl transferase